MNRVCNLLQQGVSGYTIHLTDHVRQRVLSSPSWANLPDSQLSALTKS